MSLPRQITVANFLNRFICSTSISKSWRQLLSASFARFVLVRWPSIAEDDHVGLEPELRSTHSQYTE